MRAKRYMSDEDYTYIGTITSWKLYKSVVQSPRPKLAAETDREAKVQHNAEVLKSMRKVLDGLYRDQFVNRMDDAIALCEHNWEHFRASIAEIPASRRLVPSELFLKMVSDGTRRRPTGTTREVLETAETAETSATAEWASRSSAAAPPPMRQRTHLLTAVAGISCGRSVQVAVPFGGHQPKTVDEFLSRPVAVGNFVLTKAQPQERIDRACGRLRRVPVWIWKVLHVYKPGERLPANVSCIERRDAPSYEAHLHRPSSGTSWASKVEPVWDMMAEVSFLSTGVPSDHRGPEIHVPFTALLRPEDLLGGGFLLTSARHVPNIVRTFLGSVD
jgi:hypothetical protein